MCGCPPTHTSPKYAHAPMSHAHAHAEAIFRRCQKERMNKQGKKEKTVNEQIKSRYCLNPRQKQDGRPPMCAVTWTGEASGEGVRGWLVAKRLRMCINNDVVVHSVSFYSLSLSLFFLCQQRVRYLGLRSSNFTQEVVSSKATRRRTIMTRGLLLST